MPRIVIKTAKFISIFLVGLVALIACATWLYGDKILAHYKPRIEQILSQRTGFNVSFLSSTFSFYPNFSLVLLDGKAISDSDCSPWEMKSAKLKIDLLPLVNRIVRISSIEVLGINGTARVEQGVPSLSTASGKNCAAGELPAKRFSPVGNKSRPDVGVGIEPKGLLGHPISIDLQRFAVGSVNLKIFGEKGKHDLMIDNFDSSLLINDSGLSMPKISLQAEFDKVKTTLLVTALQISNDLNVFSLKSADIELGAQKLKLSGNFDNTSKKGKGLLILSSISFDELNKLFLDNFPAVRGLLEGNLQAEIDGKILKIKGDAILSDLRIPIDGYVAAKTIKASEIVAVLDNSQLQSVDSRIFLSGLSAESDGSEYSATEVDGAISLQLNNQLGFSGDIRINNFAYADPDTKIKNVPAKLSQIRGLVNTHGDVDVKLMLDADGVYLWNESITVESVKRVTAPIEIKVPSRGGYSVSGPVTISGGVLSIAKRKLDKVDGLVDMLVSSALKDFHASKITSESFGIPLQVATHFSMTKPEYKIENTRAKIGAGEMVAGMTLQRGQSKEVVGSLQIEKLPLDEAYRAVMQSEKPPLRGSVDSLTLSLSGDRADIKKSLTGSGEIALENIIFQTINIQKLIKRSIAAIPLVGPDMVPADSPADDKDGSVAASLKVSNGTVSVSNVKANLSNMTIEGSLDVAMDQTLKGQFSVVFLQETFRLLGFGFERLGNFLAREGRVAIPLLVGRTISDPSVAPDIEAILKFVSGVDLIESVAGGIEDLAIDIFDDAGEVIDDI